MAGKQGKRHKRSLSSRKRGKDVTNATPTWERFASDKLLAEPPKNDFETKLPRKQMMMMKDMERMREIEAGGKKRPMNWYRADHGQKAPEQKGKKHKSAAVADRPVDTRPATLGADVSAAEYVPPRLKGKNAPEGATAVAAPGVAADAAGLLEGAGKKRRREVDDEPPRARLPKFGETNDAPPTLHVGGQLAKKLAMARAAEAAAQSKEAALARQRQSAIEAYAAAKARRRLEASA